MPSAILFNKKFQLNSLITYVPGTVFLILLIAKASSDQLGAHLLALTRFPNPHLASLALELTLYSAHKPDLGFNLAYRHQ